MDGLYFLPHVGKFGGVISKFWYIGGYIATTWINQGGKVSFPLLIKESYSKITVEYLYGLTVKLTIW